MRFYWIIFMLVASLAQARPFMGVLFVGGYLSGVDPSQARLFAEQKAILDRLGIPYRDVPIRSTRPFEESVPILESAMKNAPWDRYVVVSHSMGGIIALDALIGDTTLQSRLAGWIAYQSPFKGASKIDRGNAFADLFDPFRVRNLFDWTGLGRSANRMSVEERRPYMRDNARAIRELTASRHVTCVTSDWGFGTDLLIDTDSMSLPGAEIQHVAGANHMALVAPGKGSRDEQRLVFMSAMRGVLENRCREIRDL